MLVALDILTVFALLVGMFFMLIGALGIVRLPDLYSRLHASSKCITLGISGMMVAARAMLAASRGLSLRPCPSRSSSTTRLPALASDRASARFTPARPFLDRQGPVMKAVRHGPYVVEGDLFTPDRFTVRLWKLPGLPDLLD